MYIYILIIIALLLRLINIDKPEGLWNDEYISWFIASTPFNEGFWTEVLKQCHMPFYYLYLKPFSSFNDVVLRLTSVIPGILSIPVMYLVGKEFSKGKGYCCAIITSILPFLVYYSQEVRFYSILFLFSAILLLSMIKILYNKNYWWLYWLSSLLIVFTHNLGCIFVAFSLLYLAFRTKKISLKSLAGITLVTIIILFFGLNILQKLPSSQWWGNFSYTNILFLFSDYMSPILTNNVNAPANFFYNHNLLFIIFITIPTVLGLYLFTLGIKHFKGFLLIVLSYILVLLVLAVSGKIVFITKYSVEILPIIILFISLGINNKKSFTIFILFIMFNIYAIFTPYYPAKILRSEGHKLVADMINNKKSDIIIYTYYEPERFERYINQKNRSLSISKNNRFEYENNASNILDRILTKEQVSIIFLDSVSFIPEYWLQQAKSNNVPEMFITFSKIRISLEKEILKNYKNIAIEKKGSWSVITATKLK